MAKYIPVIAFGVSAVAACFIVLISIVLLSREPVMVVQGEFSCRAMLEAGVINREAFNQYAAIKGMDFRLPDDPRSPLGDIGLYRTFFKDPVMNDIRRLANCTLLCGIVCLVFSSVGAIKSLERNRVAVTPPS